MKFSKFLMFTLLCSVFILSACGEDETVNANKNEEIPEIKSTNTEPTKDVEKSEELIDPNPNNDLSTEVDILMQEFNIVLAEFQDNVNDYLYGSLGSPMEDYQKKSLLKTGETVNEKMQSIKLNTVTDGDKEISYLFEELKKYQDIRFQALKMYLDEPNDYDLEIISANTALVSDIALKMMKIRVKGYEK